MAIDNIWFGVAGSRPGAPRKFQMAKNAASSPFQNCAIDVMPQREQLAFKLANEESKLGVVGTRVHL